MTSSASPVNPSYEEQPILDSIFKLKHQIVHLKQSGRANLQDVTKMSSKLNGVVSELRSIRQDEKVTQRNQIDDILDFIWLLLFQIWGTIAHVDRRLYSIYEKLSICLARLEVMIESGVYQADCLASIQKIVDQVEEKHFKDGKFLDKGDEIMYDRKITMAFENLNEIDPEMLPIFKNLVSMNHNLSKLQGYSFDILANFQNQLHDIENKADLMNLNIDGGRAMVSNVLDKNYTLVEDMMSKLEIQPPLLEIYEELESIQRQLLSILSSPIRFSYNVDGEIRKYQNRLIEIESSSKDGVYGGSLHIMIPKGQAAISNLLNQCHSSINRLLFPDPVDFSLLEWYTKLLLTRERLRELKRLSRRGHSPANEISSIQEFLDAIEENKENGIYYGIGSHNRKQVPTGQGTFIGVVEECRRKLEKLRCFDPAGGFN